MNVLSTRPAALASAFAFLFAAAASAAPPMVRVLRVVDGRTLAVATATGETLITLAGIDLPWVDQNPGGRSHAAEFLHTSLAGKWVMIERDASPAPSTATPVYWVYRSPDGLDVSREVIRRGLAVLTKQPCSRSGELLDVEREARGGLSTDWNQSSLVTGHAMTYLGTIDPPHVRRDRNGALTTRKATAQPKSSAKSPIVVVVERPSSQQ
jgi:endonuclease YncB( thermonuclease family)